MDGCQYNSGDTSGWRCKDEEIVCWGYTGEQVITSLGKTLGGDELVEGKSKVVRDVFSLGGLAIAWLLGALYLVSKMNTQELKLFGEHTLDADGKGPTKYECIDEDSGAVSDTKSIADVAETEAFRESESLEIGIPHQNTTFTWDNLEYIIPDADKLDQDKVDFAEKQGTTDEVAKLKKHDTYILKGVSGGLHKGQAMCILGPSGAKKTSLLLMFTLEAYKGILEVLSNSVTNKSMPKFLAHTVGLFDSLKGLGIT